MVLGHTFACDNLEQAERLTKLLRKSGISTRIEPVTSSHFSIRVKGTFDNIHSYLVHCREELTQDLENEMRNVQEEKQDNPDDLHENEVIEDTKEDLEAVERILSTLALDRDNALKTLEEMKEGDIVYDRDAEPDNTDEVKVNPIITAIMRNKVLLDNDLISIRDNKMIIRKIIPAEELFYTFQPTSGIIPTEDELESFNIALVQLMNADVEYYVHTGPELIFKIDVTELHDELENSDISHESIAIALQAIYVKQEIVEHIVQ
ncbi:hypothetical protein, partial [Methanospirillum hungatei]|uniref:hypothetical protein n=1 Tax=Methanospirillum hungatei TaxID=2203 RepID=UPI0026EABA7F